MIAFGSVGEMFGEDFDLCILSVSMEFELRLRTADVVFQEREEVPNNLPLFAQLRLKDGAGPNTECESGLAKTLTLSRAFAVKLRTPSVRSQEQNESSDTFVAPALCVL